MICPKCGNVITHNSYFDAYYCPRCGEFIREKPPMTNADRIRAMSDEELAGFLMKLMGHAQCFAEGIFPYHPCPQNYNCKQCGIEWLQQPAEEDDK